jgi:nicotinamide-nucleotide amidase
MSALADQVIRHAKACGATIVTAESCTAGAVAHALSKAKGAGTVLKGGFITYTKEMKASVLGVPMQVLKEKTAVCEEVALAMACGALRASDATVSAAITGVAGPEPDEDGNPVGLVYCAVGCKEGRFIAEKCEFGPLERDEVIRRATECALRLLLRVCEK